jgi:putative phosphoesterase
VTFHPHSVPEGLSAQTGRFAAVTAPLRVIVLADTHLRAGRAHAGRPARDLPLRAWELIEGADIVLHAGDVLESDLLERLGHVATTYAVLGNNDVTLVGCLPETRVLDLAGVRVAMIHDSGQRAGRAERLRRKFADAAIVVFGHSHIPCDATGIDGQVLFNPGSPTTRRSQPVRTLGELVLADGQIVERRIVDLGP